MDEVLTLEELAERLRVNIRTATKMIETGKIQAVRVGRQYRITRVALQEFLQIPPEKRGEASA